MVKARLTTNKSCFTQDGTVRHQSYVPLRKQLAQCMAMGSPITKAARLQPCTLRLNGCKNDIPTVVFAHAPSVEKGLGRKSPDFWGCFACSHCHDILDGRKKRGSIMEKELLERLLKAIFETQMILVKLGLISYND